MTTFLFYFSLSLVGGTLLGLGMRAWDDWRERADCEAGKNPPKS